MFVKWMNGDKKQLSDTISFSVVVLSMLFHSASAEYLEINPSWRMHHAFHYNLVQREFDMLQQLKALVSPEGKHIHAEAEL